MAKFEIVSVGVDGQYTTKEHLDVTGIANRITDLQNQSTNLTSINTQIEGELVILEAELISVQAQIEIYLLAEPPNTEEATTLILYSHTVARLIGKLKRQKNINTLTIEANNKNIIGLQAALDQADVIQNAVCIDGSDTLTVGQLVGSIELNRYPTQKTGGYKALLKAGFVSAAYDSVKDGIVQPAIAMSASAVFFNQAMIPAAQRFISRYIAATVDSINTGTDTMNVTALAYPGNHPASWWEGATPTRFPEESLSNIPVVYRDCNSAAFTVADEVVVEIVGGTTPTVIGFVDNPQPCAGISLELEVISSSGYTCYLKLANNEVWDSTILPDMNITGDFVFVDGSRTLYFGDWPLTDNGIVRYRRDASDGIKEAAFRYNQVYLSTVDDYYMLAFKWQPHAPDGNPYTYFNDVFPGDIVTYEE